MEVESFYKYLISNGYYFDKELVENFLLSLKVKPFVILTGNSGTGKTKLSQLFAKFVSEFDGGGSGKPRMPNGYFTVKAKTNYSSWANMGWSLAKNDFEDILPIRECESRFDMTIDGMPVEGSIDILVQLFYTNESLKSYFKNLFDENENSYVDLKIDCEDIKKILSDYNNTGDSITVTQKSNKTAANSRQWMLSKSFYEYIPFKHGFINCKVKVGDVVSNARFRVLARLSFKKNDKIEEYLSNNIGKDVTVEIKNAKFNFDDFKPKFNCESNDSSETTLSDYGIDVPKYVIVPVGANWTDNTNILGYYNVITEEYQSTPAYELIKKAQEDPDNPYFLILDEMNLSHVERYFADFLSAIESGEEIPLYGVDRTLEIPYNLFIVGTVNVDETTYMFSPKVLDRANTIEFDTLSAWEYMVSDLELTDFEGDAEYLQSPLRNLDVLNLRVEDLKGIFDEISYNGESLWDTLAMELTIFQETLKGSGFDFGFRVINEILRFMVVAWVYESPQDEWINWERYFDAQIKQKILPKLHGSEKAIGNVLTALFNLCLVERNNNENPNNFTLTKDNCRYFDSAAKLQDMSKVLSDQRYVSFIN